MDMNLRVLDLQLIEDKTLVSPNDVMRLEGITEVKGYLENGIEAGISGKGKLRLRDLVTENINEGVDEYSLDLDLTMLEVWPVEDDIHPQPGDSDADLTIDNQPNQEMLNSQSVDFMAEVSTDEMGNDDALVRGDSTGSGLTIRIPSRNQKGLPFHDALML